jgi:hypothetical protein
MVGHGIPEMRMYDPRTYGDERATSNMGLSALPSPDPQDVEAPSGPKCQRALVAHRDRHARRSDDLPPFMPVSLTVR